MCRILPVMLSQACGEELYSALREDIEGDKDVEKTVDNYRPNSELCGERRTAIIAEALERRNWEDGQNHLMYAARLGSEKSFVSLVKIIRKTVSTVTVTIS